MNRLLLILMLCSTFLIQAQDRVSAIVKDAKSGQAVPFASVSVSPGGQSSITDEYGSFIIVFNDYAAVEVSISHISYKEFKQTVKRGNFPSKQAVFQLQPDSVILSDMVVTATRMNSNASDVPARVGVIGLTRIHSTPANNTDDLIRNESNVFINRTQGIFSKSAGVMMRGLSGTARTLLLIDGVPLNKTAGGSVPWNTILPDDLESVEIVKGPVSTVYGSNAMAGVINMRTQIPVEKFSIKAGLYGGTYNTFGGKLRIQGNEDLKKGQLYYKASGFYRQGDGYYLVPEETRDSTDDKNFLNEYQLNLKTGYLSGKHRIDVSYQQYYAKHGTGQKVYEPEGSNDELWNHLISSTYALTNNKWDLSIMLFTQIGDVASTKERLNNSGIYKLNDDYTRTFDAGSWISLRRKFKNNILTIGMDAKIGQQDSESIYRTSTDHLFYEGKLFFGGIFIQDEISFNDIPVRIVAGLRADFANFFDGSMSIEDPTSNTGFIQSEDFTYNNNSWTQLSPKIAVMYDIDDDYKIFLSFGSGFNPPKLDDLIRSGKISKGFKIANPQLKPEWVNTLELGAKMSPAKGLSLALSGYYTMGDDFQYFVATGDSTYDGSELRPVVQRKNISSVEILGVELDAKYWLMDKHEIFINAAYNQPKIKDFRGNPETNKDLTGKTLIEVPAYLFNGGFNFYHRWFNASLFYSYFGQQWYDDENTQTVAAYSTTGFKISRTFKEQWTIMLTVDNLFDTEYTDRKGYLGPGRFIIAEFNYRFTKPK